MNSMNQTRCWQKVLIAVVLLLTIYNILPTIIYYSQPLNAPINQYQGEEIEKKFLVRAIESPEKTKEWLLGLFSNLQVKPKSIEIDPKNSTMIHAQFVTASDAQKVSQWIEYAGSLSIFEKARQPFIANIDGTHVTIALRVPYIPKTVEEGKSLYTFIKKENAENSGSLSEEYLQYIGGRYIPIVEIMTDGFFLENEARQVAKVLENKYKDAPPLSSEMKHDLVRPFLSKIGAYTALLQKKSSYNESENRTIQNILTNSLIASLYSIRENINDDFASRPESDGKNAVVRPEYTLSMVQKELVEMIRELPSVDMASAGDASSQLYQMVITAYKNLPDLTSYNAIGKKTVSEYRNWYNDEAVRINAKLALDPVDGEDYSISVPLGSMSPLFGTISFDYTADRIELNASQEVCSILNLANERKIGDISAVISFLKEELLHEASRLGERSFEKVDVLSDSAFQIPLFTDSPVSSFIALADSGEKYTNNMASSLVEEIEAVWSPKSTDFSSDVYPRVTFDEFSKMTNHADRKMCMLLFSPVGTAFSAGHFLKPTSFYVVLRGAKKILDSSPNDQARELLLQDYTALQRFLEARGFQAYTGQEIQDAYGSVEFLSDIIFELEHCASPFLSLTGEAFQLKGDSAILEFSNLENRLRVENRMSDKEQENLVRWKEAWQSAQVSMNPHERLAIPKPNANVFISNVKTGATKYLRGDYSHVLHWGLDLSGGKSVKIGLYDSAMRPVVNPSELNQTVSELYRRLNSMGVSERVIRVENSTISIDFPGSQEISSSELIQASAMYFHIVNEKFGPMNRKLAANTDQFLQEVWNEAVLTHQEDLMSVNAIAARRLHMAQVASDSFTTSESAKILVHEGLQIANPFDLDISKPTTAFDDTLSTIVRYRGDDTIEPMTAMNHPLMIVFRNYALEGANLEHVAPSYDPAKGNILSFQVKTEESNATSKGNPQEALYAWTSKFCLDAIQGSSLQDFSQGRGWRMAVVLNGTVISDPALYASIRDSAYISGRFSQREVQKLARDLEAGSLSYTPKILSEYNVSPELGKAERDRGIFASLLAVLSVIGIMVVYYRFLGVVASVAVLVNIFIIWAVMQNIGAAMTLPALAGIVLTVGMAVDANVLVFERIREELKRGIQVASAIQAGYKRAFSAIVDSNLTTILAAFILIQFDSGPIRGFAVTLIIGILSSMFTALFMTRVYTTGWIQRHKDIKTLSMASWFPETPKYNFFKYTKQWVVVSVVIALCGAVFAVYNIRTLLGMDFTGGYALTVEVEPPHNNHSVKDAVALSLEKAGLKAGQFHIRELGDPNYLRIQLSSALDEEGQIFHTLPSQSVYSGMDNSKIDWIVHALRDGGVSISSEEIARLPTQWTVMSGQFSNTMRNNALYALSLALFAILIYIAVRFEWKYAISSVLALIHDVIMTLAVLSLFGFFGFHFQFNLEVVGALMTIIGYSLNDTIIVFDRVREEQRIHRKMNFQEIVNFALNSTLSRTIMTSSTTLAVLLMLVLFGGASIFTFSFVMFIGVFLGTISSLFIAAPLLVYFDRQETV